MSRNSELELTIRDILHVINPSGEDWSIRFHIIEELKAVVQSLESLRGATVEPFGSFVSNLFTRWGDLDISVEIPNGLYISSAGKKRKQALLGDLLRALRRKGGCHKLMFIANARVPILKFESKHQNISCDISINNLNGQMKSKLLFWINEIDGRFRDMVLLVKVWAKARGINDSKSGTLNSYTISMLIIFHFQTCSPAIFPPLREIYPGNMVEDLTGVRADAEKHIEEICAASINRIKADRFRMVNRTSLTDLFIDFLAKFSDLSSRALQQGICPYTGQWEDIDSNTRWLPKTYALFVEDPFEQPINSARTVSSNQMGKITDAFWTTHQILISSNQNRNDLIASLATPQVSFLVARTWLGNPSADYYSGGGGYYPSRAAHLPSTSTSQPQQFQNARYQHMIPNNVTVTQRPPQASNSHRHRNPNNGIVMQRPASQVSNTHQHRNPNNGVVQRPPSQASNNNRNPNNGAPSQASNIQQQHRNRNNGTAQRPPPQAWRPRSD